MTPLQKIEQFLINDGIPNQHMVDHLIDDTVDKMVEKYISRPDDRSVEEDKIELIDQARSLVKKACIGIDARQKDFGEIFSMVKVSLERYYPYVQLDAQKDPLERKAVIKKYYPNEETVVTLGFDIKLEITPQMKKTAVLYNKLQNNIEQKTDSKPKLKI